MTESFNFLDVSVMILGLSSDWNEGVCGNNSAVECNLAKVEVAGSNPVSRSRGGIAKW